MSAWWAALHALVAAAIGLVGVPWVLKAAASVALLAHAVVRRPRVPPRVLYRSDGRIALPELGVEGLELGPGTLYTTAWARLDLRGRACALEVLLVADQVEPETWRALQAELRQSFCAGGNAGTVRQSDPFTGRDLR